MWKQTVAERLIAVHGHLERFGQEELHSAVALLVEIVEDQQREIEELKKDVSHADRLLCWRPLADLQH